MVTLNKKLVWSERFVDLAPLLADWLVFTYPVLLVVWYVFGIMKHDESMKIWALYVFTSAWLAAFVNIVLQFFIDKQRPEWYIDNADLLIMDHLPTAPFPSDHAAVSMAVWVATFLRAWKNWYTNLVVVWILLIIWSLIMSLARVWVAIHRPTDVVAWTIIWLLVAVFLHQKMYQNWIISSFFSWLIWLQERIFSKIWLLWY